MYADNFVKMLLFKLLMFCLFLFAFTYLLFLFHYSQSKTFKSVGSVLPTEPLANAPR